MAIITSSVEVYKREALGYLIGSKGVDAFLIEYAIPYQSVKSTFTEVEMDDMKIEEINSLVSSFVETNLRYIGDFHSHTSYSNKPAPPEPSKEDLKSSLPGEIYVICAVNPKGRTIKWHVNRRGILVGTIGKYKIEIAAYCVSVKKRVIKAEIKCPSLTRQA